MILMLPQDAICLRPVSTKHLKDSGTLYRYGYYGLSQEDALSIKVVIDHEIKVALIYIATVAHHLCHENMLPNWDNAMVQEMIVKSFQRGEYVVVLKAIKYIKDWVILHEDDMQRHEVDAGFVELFADVAIGNIEYYIYGNVPNKERVNLTTLLRYIQAEYSRREYGGHAAVDIIAETDVTEIIAIKSIFYRILFNLMDNAVIHGNATRIFLKISKTDEIVSIVVQDNGKGIPDEFINENIPVYRDSDQMAAKIFSLSFRNGKIITKGEIGLYVCYKGAQYHNGSISVDSELGKGTTFTIRLPVANKFKNAIEIATRLVNRFNSQTSDLAKDMLTFAQHIDRIGIKPGQRVLMIGPANNQIATVICALYGCEVDIVEPDGMYLDDLVVYAEDDIRLFYGDNEKAATEALSRIKPMRRCLRDIDITPNRKYDFVVAFNILDLLVRDETGANDMKALWETLADNAILIVSFLEINRVKQLEESAIAAGFEIVKSEAYSEDFHLTESRFKYTVTVKRPQTKEVIPNSRTYANIYSAA